MSAEPIVNDNNTNNDAPDAGNKANAKTKKNKSSKATNNSSKTAAAGQLAVKKTAGKRHVNSARPSDVSAIGNPGLRRLARKGGVKRVSNESFDAGREMLNQFVNSIVRDAVIFSEAAQRKTVTASDVNMSLKRNGCALYGYN